MKKYYNLNNDKDIDEDKNSEQNSDVEDKDRGKTPKSEAEKRIEYLNKMSRGELSSDSSDSSDLEEEVDDEVDVKVKEDIPLGGETKRIAIMNCDWSRMRAVDLYALFQVNDSDGFIL